MTRLRFSRRRLQIKIGRYTIPKTHIHDRLCMNCSDNLVEDEVHLLLGCSKFNDLMRDCVTSCFNKNINRTNDISSKFIWLLSNEDNDVCRKIARFIKKKLVCLEQNLKSTTSIYLSVYMLAHCTIYIVIMFYSHYCLPWNT